MQKWKTTYNISDEQAERIKRIEIDFHGNGSPFSVEHVHSKEERRLHHEEISRQMSAKDGARFMQLMEKSDGWH